MADAADPPWQLAPELRPPPEVTAAGFRAWRNPRRGAANPERQTNPVWTWLARNPTITAWAANHHFGGSDHAGHPTWTNHRFGQTTTALPDGRTLHIAGEHEDFYDPDFYIYNDVHVTEPGGALAIYGYPTAVFPPTDFHSATVVDAHVWVIGNLGDARTRVPRATPVFQLDTRTLAFARVDTTGANPGWLSNHVAAASPDGATITVRGGRREVVVGGRPALRVNCDDFALDLASGVWTQLTDRRWRQWRLERDDGASNRLFEVRWYARHVDDERPDQRAQAADELARIGHAPDLAAWAARFAPPVAHTPRANDDDDQWRTTQIAIDGVTVRFDEHDDHVLVTIEGALPDATVATVIEDARAKLARVEATGYRAISLDA